jgi:acyl-coenzyme A thioesterase PaaI-like protein
VCLELAWVADCDKTRRYTADGRIKKRGRKTHLKEVEIKRNKALRKRMRGTNKMRK